MIMVRFIGRFGNQLFQYAFAYSLSKKLKTRFYMDNTLFENIIQNYFTLRIGEKNINLHGEKICRFKKLKEIKLSNFDSPKDNLENIKNNALYLGYFQSEEYFTESVKNIFKLFKIKKKYVNEFQLKYGKFFKENKVVAIHLRRTDYLEHSNEALGGKNMTIPLSYYHKCLKEIGNLSEYKFIFVSDDISFVKSSFAESENFLFESNNEIIDFQILLNADILCIANSSFSWWAAYLNKRCKTIYAPKYWLGFKVKKEYPNGIMNSKWNWLDV